MGNTVVNFRPEGNVYYLEMDNKQFAEKFWEVYGVCKKQLTDMGFVVRKEGTAKKTAAKKTAASGEGSDTPKAADKWLIYYDTTADLGADILKEKVAFIKEAYPKYEEKVAQAEKELIAAFREEIKKRKTGAPAAVANVVSF